MQNGKKSKRVTHADVLRQIQQSLRTVQQMYFKNQHNSPEAEGARRRAMDLAAEYIPLLEDCQKLFGNRRSRRCLDDLKDYDEIPVAERSDKYWSGDPSPTNSAVYGDSLWEIYPGMEKGVEYRFIDDVGKWAEKCIGLDIMSELPSGKLTEVVEIREKDFNMSKSFRLLVEIVKDRSRKGVKCNYRIRHGLADNLRHPGHRGKYDDVADSLKYRNGKLTTTIPPGKIRIVFE